MNPDDPMRAQDSGGPQQGGTGRAALSERVAAVIDRIRPAIQGDGGDVELVGVDDTGVVRVRLHGACIGCPSAGMTLALGIEHNLKVHVPEVTSVVCV